MELIIVELTLLLMAAIFWICAVLIKAYERRTQKEKIKMEGVVVGYVSRDGGKPMELCEKYVGVAQKQVDDFVNKHRSFVNSPWRPVISVETNGETVKGIVICNRMWPNIHPVGTKLQVLYRSRKLPLKGYSNEIEVDEEGLKPLSLNAISILFKIISLVILAAAITIAVIWIKNN